jgi:polar amino acid transport system substrate-binding protein
MKLLLILCLCTFSLGAFAKEPPPGAAYYGVNTDYAMPLVELKRTQQDPAELECGILKDLGEAIFKELGLKPLWFLLPKRRVAPSLISGDVSIICHLNEVWQPAIYKDVYWSKELYQSTNLIVFVGKKPIKKIKDLYGERIGVVLNFIYQSLDAYFKSGDIIRENGPNNESNVQKLLHGRLQFAVMSNLEFEFFKKTYPNLESVDLGMDTVMTKCALSRKSKITIEQLNKAIDTIKRNGTLEKILKTY